MSIPPKRKSNRAERRAAQRGPAGNGTGDMTEAVEVIPAPPSGGCAAFHWYWCVGHNDWHHHTEPAVAAIVASIEEASNR